MVAINFHSWKYYPSMVGTQTIYHNLYSETHFSLLNTTKICLVAYSTLLGENPLPVGVFGPKFKNRFFESYFRFKEMIVWAFHCYWVLVSLDNWWEESHILSSNSAYWYLGSICKFMTNIWNPTKFSFFFVRKHVFCLIL